MAGFVIYPRLTEQELRESAAETIPKIETFFVQNPKRRVCRSELWYGKAHSIKKKDVAGQINAIVEELLKEDRPKLLEES
jgi:hypothetical protein